jgi:hypothetical protein
MATAWTRHSSCRRRKAAFHRRRPDKHASSPSTTNGWRIATVLLSSGVPMQPGRSVEKAVSAETLRLREGQAPKARHIRHAHPKRSSPPPERPRSRPRSKPLDRAGLENRNAHRGPRLATHENRESQKPAPGESPTIHQPQKCSS